MTKSNGLKVLTIRQLNNGDNGDNGDKRFHLSYIFYQSIYFLIATTNIIHYSNCKCVCLKNTRIITSLYTHPLHSLDLTTLAYFAPGWR